MWREEIADLEEDVQGWEKTVAQNRAEIPALERELLTCERDVAIAKLKIIELRADLSSISLGGDEGGESVLSEWNSSMVSIEFACFLRLIGSSLNCSSKPVSLVTLTLPL